MTSVENPFQVVISRALGTVVVAIRGELDTYTAPQLQDQLRDLIDDQGNRSVVLELSDMTFIDSSGLAVLVDALKRMRHHGGTLTLSGATTMTSKVLEISGLSKVFALQPAGEARR